MLVNGVVLAVNYALIALGITLIFSIMNILNFAHGQMFMIGGFVVYYLYGLFKVNYFLSLIAVVLVLGIGTTLGVVAQTAVLLVAIRRERISLRPLWGIDDPAAGAWFPQEALQLAQDASPALP